MIFSFVFLFFFLLTFPPKILLSFWQPITTQVSQWDASQKMCATGLENSPNDFLVSQNSRLWLWKNSSWTRLCDLKNNEVIQKIFPYGIDKSVFLVKSGIYFCDWRKKILLKKIIIPSSIKKIGDIFISPLSGLWITTSEGIFYSKDLGKKWYCFWKSKAKNRGNKDCDSIYVSQKNVFFLRGKTFLVFDRKKKKCITSCFLEDLERKNFFFKKKEKVFFRNKIDRAVDSKTIWIHFNGTLIAFCWEDSSRIYQKVNIATFPLDCEIKGFSLWGCPWIITSKGCFILKKIEHYWSKPKFSELDCPPSFLWTFLKKLFVLSGGVLYRWEDHCLLQDYSYFDREPKIQAVHRQVLLSERLNVAFLKKKFFFFQGMRWVPEITISFKHSKDNDWKTYAQVNKFVAIYGKDKEFRINCVWNFDKDDDLMNEKEREKAKNKHIELKEKLLRKVTEIYFERRRQQLSLLLQSDWSERQKIAKTMQIQELTAQIDVYTGGWFSHQLEQVPL